MDDPRPRRHHPEVAERLLTPAQEEVALAVALVLEAHILREGPVRAVRVHLHGVVDHEVDRLQRVDPLRISPHRLERLAHGGQVDHRRHAREVLKQHARRRECHLALLARVRPPVRQRLDVVVRDGVAVLATQQVLQQHPLREREAHRRRPLEDRIEPVEGDRAPSHRQRVAAVETVEHDGIAPACTLHTDSCLGPVGPGFGAFGTKPRQYTASRAPGPRAGSVAPHARLYCGQGL